MSDAQPLTTDGHAPNGRPRTLRPALSDGPLRLALPGDDGREAGLLRDVLDALHTYAAILDDRGRVVTVNRAALERSGVAAGAVAGVTFAESAWWSHDPRQSRLVAKAVADALAGRTARLELTARLPGVAGEDGQAALLDVDAQFAPLPARRGRGVVVAAYDLTDARRQTREQAEQAAELSRLADAEAGKMRAISTLAHELRNPLGAAHMAAQMLEEAGEYDAETVELMGRNLRMMRRLVDDLMDLGRAERGTLQVKLEPVDLCDLIAQAADEQAADAREAGHEIAVVGRDAPCVVRGDAQRLKQVLFNLVRNALRYTDPPGRVTLSVAPRRDGGADLVVADTGRGLSADLLPRLFEPFQQGDDTSGGLGIGLSLCRRIARAHGGDVTAHSDGPGTGSTFRVRLPGGPAPADSPEVGR